jgi:four helix bundle protein
MPRIYWVILEVIRELRPFVRELERVDRNLAEQMKRAEESMALNTSEGWGSRGRTRRVRFATGCGSANETMSCVDVAAAMHDIEAPKESTLEKLRHVIGALTILSR